MRPSHKYRFIAEGHVPYSVGQQCTTLQVSRSGYYQWLKQRQTGAVSQRSQDNEALLERIRTIYSESRRSYGSPRITEELRDKGHRCNHKRVERLMRLDGLQARARRAHCVTTVSDHSKASPNLLDRHFATERPGQAWTGDITYVRTNEGWLYVASVLDLCTRRVVGLAMGSTMEAELVVAALTQAIGRHRPATGLLLHSDRGVQYSSNAYREVVRQHGFRQSMSRKGNCWDNAPAESFFKTLKVECVYQHRYTTREQAKRSIFEYVEVFYNRQRRHSALNFQSPETFEAQINKASTTD